MIPAIIPIAIQLASFAPSLMKFFGAGEPSVAVAEKVVDIAQNITGTKSPSEALAKMKEDSEAAAAFNIKVMENDTALTAMFLADIQDARKRDVALQTAGIKNYRANLLLAFACSSVIVCLGVVVIMSDLNEFSKGVITLILGRTLGWVEQAFSFDFGSTRESAAKNNTIADQARLILRKEKQ